MDWSVLYSGMAPVWILAGAVVGYLFSIVFTSITMKMGYPPNMARLGCWLGLTLWLLFIGFVVFGVILAVHLPLWMLVILLCLIGVFGMAFYLGRRQPIR